MKKKMPLLVAIILGVAILKIIFPELSYWFADIFKKIFLNIR